MKIPLSTGVCRSACEASLSVMTTRLTLALLALSACVSSAPGGTEADLRRRIATSDSAWAAKDVAGVDQVLAPEYTYFTSNGGLSDRAASLEFLTDTAYHLTRSERTEVQVTISGAVARISSRWQGEGMYRGDVVQDDQTCGQTWVYRGARWMLFTEHCVNRVKADSVASAADSG